MIIFEKKYLTKIKLSATTSNVMQEIYVREKDDRTKGVAFEFLEGQI